VRRLWAYSLLAGEKLEKRKENKKEKRGEERNRIYIYIKVYRNTRLWACSMCTLTVSQSPP
jgi:hypothetical protein